MATISDIALASGVSTATVSYVLNNTTHKVRAHTRQRVLDAARDLNYRPNAMARGLNGKSVNTIGIVIFVSVTSPLDDPYYRSIISGMSDEVTAHKKSLNFFNGIWLREDDELLPFCDGRCDGLLIFLPNIGDQVLNALKRQSIPFVVIGEGGSDASVSSIDIDNIAAAREVTRLMITQGHTRIAHFEGDEGLQSTFDRLQGYREALEAGGIEFDASLVIPGGYDARTGYERAKQMFSGRGGTPTAVFAANDVIAYAAIDAVQDLGLRVPEDVSVVGIDGIEPQHRHRLKLTTADQHLRLLGSNAAKLLLEQLNSGSKATTKIVQPFDLKIGESVATPAA